MIYKINDKDKAAIDECYRTHGELIPQVLRKISKCSIGKAQWICENIKLYSDIDKFDKISQEMMR